MRCLACNCNLNDYESTRKSVNTNQFIDLCNGCFSSVSEDVQTIDREDLLTENNSYNTDSFLDNYKEL